MMIEHFVGDMEFKIIKNFISKCKYNINLN